MQTNVAHTQTLTQSRGLSKRLRPWVLLGLQVIVFLAVTKPLFRQILVNAGESDAKSAVRLIGRQLAALPDSPPDDLAVWMRDQTELRHRLADARILDAHLEYHGYRISWKPAGEDSPLRGTVWAVPIDPGNTGYTRFHLQVR
ncbi:MAG: hypothetical protein GY930_07130 [bacterium]|nr:hypothetical protein [bacterium]